jgi:hypothetical protein
MVSGLSGPERGTVYQTAVERCRTCNAAGLWGWPSMMTTGTSRPPILTLLILPIQRLPRPAKATFVSPGPYPLAFTIPWPDPTGCTQGMHLTEAWASNRDFGNAAPRMTTNAARRTLLCWRKTGRIKGYKAIRPAKFQSGRYVLFSFVFHWLYGKHLDSGSVSAASKRSVRPWRWKWPDA